MLSVASTAIDDPRLAIRTIFAKLDLASLTGVLLFCSSRYVSEAIAHESLQQQPVCTVLGCTTAGEINGRGFSSGITAIGFPAADFTLKATRFDKLDEFDPVGVKVAVERLAAQSSAESARLGDRLHRVALLLIDGLSHREELFAHALQNCLGPMTLIGASAGDDMAFKRTAVLHEGIFRTDSAALAILTSRRPLQPFCRRYGIAGAKRAIVTNVEPVERRVYELNGENAALEYARLIDVPRSELCPRIFAAHPLMVRVAGQYYARSVQSLCDDGSLVFQAAIARGLVTYLGNPENIVTSLTDTLASLRAQLGEVDALLVFDDVINKLESERAGYGQELERLYADNGVVGFHTYGEQYRELHLNQSLVGLAIGGEPR